MTTAFETEVELLIDSGTLHGTLEAVVTACHAKAEHLRSVWQDEHDARTWEAAAKAIDHVLNLAVVKQL